MKERIVISGGSGFLGGVLKDYFGGKGYEVVILTRTPNRNCPEEIYWDAKSLGNWTNVLENSFAVINLTGRSVDCRYHEGNRRAIMESRVLSTRILGEAISKAQHAPKVWLNSSTATIYKHTYGSAWDESGKVGHTDEIEDKFSIETAVAWERELSLAPTPNTRKAALRTAMVLGEAKNSVFPVLARLAKLGLGGKMGDGKQFVSWIHGLDFARAIDWILSQESLSGVINVCAPAPLTNSEMMQIMRKVCGRQFGLPATKMMLEFGAFFLRTETELILKSRRVIPRRLMESGFEFTFSDFNAAASGLAGGIN